MCDCIFGFDSRAFEDEDLFLKRADELFQVPWKVQKLGKLLDIFPCLYKLLAVPTSPPAANRWFVDLMRDAIEVRRKCRIQRDDYLNFLMELQTRYDLSVEDVAGYGFTFFFDGYETSNAFLSAGLSFLAKNSNCQERLRNEISTHENIDYDQLNQMPYLDCVFNGTSFFQKKISSDFLFLLHTRFDIFRFAEILRLAPFPFRVRKKCTKSVALTDYDGSVLKVEEGIDVLLPMFSLQNHDAFYAEPDVFNPDRFCENSGGAKQFRDSGAFMPFGNGPRVCVGRERQGRIMNSNDENGFSDHHFQECDSRRHKSRLPSSRYSSTSRSYRPRRQHTQGRRRNQGFWLTISPSWPLEKFLSNKMPSQAIACLNIKSLLCWWGEWGRK